jgi:hypothetical protein
VEQLAQGHLLDLIRLGCGHQGLRRLRLLKHKGRRTKGEQGGGGSEALAC